MSFLAWFLVGWLVLAAVTLGWLWWEMRHAPMDPHEPDEFYVPDDWLFPPRVEDESTVRHGGLGR